MAYERRIYTLSGKPEEVIAVAFAKCSRDPRPFDVIVEELDADKSRRFHERWVVGYGHSSVAEHAIAHIAIENISILATKVLEDTRLASYTEKSTRYQVMEAGKCYRPKNLPPAGEGFFGTAVAELFKVYALATEKVAELMRKKFPMENMPEQRYSDMIRSKTCDVTRCLLPAGTMTQLGTTMNARSLEHCLSKLLSSPMIEMQEIGAEMKAIALKELPTLVKHAVENPFIHGYAAQLEDIIAKIPATNAGKDVELVRWTADSIHRIVSAMLFRGSELPYSAVAGYVEGMKREERAGVIESVMSQRGPHDPAPREFEEASLTFGLLVDYGAYRDIQRHRIMSQTPQALNVSHGFEIPEEIVEAGVKQAYEDAMNFAAEAFGVIGCDNPLEAQYVVPLGYRMRLLMTMNLREAFHFCELRSGNRGHISYRRVAQKMADEISNVYPGIGKHMRIDRS
ncbi:MAG TPA: FAD-dependent thymidylate synthase [Nanoarchaeota archaeon]|nr:FAD-dependent thymidylate synthase [Nanoarchaeota archaeon]